MKELTERQRNILRFLADYAKSNGYPPTVREIGGHFMILWAAARRHLQAIEKKGYIRINPSRSRGIEIVSLKPSQGIMLPVAGKIRAGRPALAVEDIDTHLLVDKSLFPAEDSFSLRVTGDSMVEAGIFDGDYVVVKPQGEIKSGEIGVVLLGEEATVKKVTIKKGSITLVPANKSMEAVTYKPDEVKVLGKVIGVIRKLS